MGFSDVTVLLSLLQKNDIISLHGLMPRQFGDPDRAASLESVRQWLFGELPTHYSASVHPLNRPGRAAGQLVGGNLTLLVNSIGTPTDLDFGGKILFIEDIDETLFSLDRMLTQLRRAGHLRDLAGLVVGQFTDMRTNSSLPFNKDSVEIIADAVADYSYPVLFDFPAGHVEYNLALPIGKSVELVVQKKKARINF